MKVDIVTQPTNLIIEGEGSEIITIAGQRIKLL